MSWPVWVLYWAMSMPDSLRKFSTAVSQAISISVGEWDWAMGELDPFIAAMYFSMLGTLVVRRLSNHDEAAGPMPMYGLFAQ